MRLSEKLFKSIREEEERLLEVTKIQTMTILAQVQLVRIEHQFETEPT